MASRGYGAYGGRATQAPGMMRDGPFPGALRPAGPHHPLEPLPPHELLERKMAAQAAEIEKLLRENQNLAATHAAMREEISANQREMQRIKSHVGSVRAESDIQVRGLLEKIRKMEDDIHAGEMVKKELQQAHKEAQSLIARRQELTGELQILTEELQKAGANDKSLPELLTDLDVLRQEHQKLRVAFEREKGLNTEQVEQMRATEKNLISLAREVEKLRADMMNSEKREHGNPHAGTYGSPGPLYPSASQGIGYGHGHGGGYPNAGFGHGSPAGYAQPYGRPQPQVTGGEPQGRATGYADGYGGHQAQLSSGAVVASRAGYPDGYGRPQVPVAGGYPDGYGRPQVPVAGDGMAVGEGVNHYAGLRSVSPIDAAK